MSVGAGRSVVIVGGGVIGAACAHYLLAENWSVTVVDKGRFGGACSHGNCGLVCPSHVLPMAEPGAVWRTLKAVLRKGSPLYVKPRLSPSLWGWLVNFARRCNRRDMMAAGRALRAMLDASMGLYRELIAGGGIRCEWEQRGLLLAYRDAAAMEAYAPTDRLLAEEFHEPARRYDGEQLLALEPALKPGLAGGWFYESDAHLRPDLLMGSWRKLLESRGARVVERAEFQGFTRRDGRATAARTSEGELGADAFVVAAGAWAPLLCKSLGVELPIQPGKGYSITMPRPAVCPSVPMIFPETRVAVTPWKSGYRLGSTMEFAGYDARINRRRLGLLRRGAEPYLRAPWAEPVEEEWFGWRPMTYDGLPIIGPGRDPSNVVIAAGHGMLGITLAPATGRLVADLMSGRPPRLDPRPYSPDRF